MLGAVAFALLGGGWWIWFERAQGHPLPLGGLLLVLASALILAAVLATMLGHPEGIRDWVQGGVVGVTASPNGRLRWFDWAIAFTRLGTLDPQGGYVKLEQRLLCGLIPVGNVLRPIREYYRVEVRSEPRYRAQSQRTRSLASMIQEPNARVLVGYDYSVSLVDRTGDRLCVLDLTAGTGRREEAFIAGLRKALEDAVGRPGLPLPGVPLAPPPSAPSPPRGEQEAQRGDAFEAWRKNKGDPTA